MPDGVEIHVTRALDGAPRLSLFAHLDNAACF